METRKTLGPNQNGEICVKGPVLFEDYIGKDINEDLDEDGFYKTGDIAYYDNEGYFYIVDRIKELIKYKAGQVNQILGNPTVTCIQTRSYQIKIQELILRNRYKFEKIS